MKKKLLISLSSFGLVAGFWACGDGSVEPLNEETDGYVKAMLETQSIDFASQVADAKKNCAADVICENEMAKAQGSAIQIESSAAPTPESSDGNPQPVSSSSSRDFFNNFSSRGPIGQQSSSSVAPVVVESSSSEVNVPAGQFGTCFAGLSTAPKTSAELGESVTWTFKPNTAVIKTNELLKIMINWSFPNGTPDSYAGTQGKTTGLTSYSVSGTKTAVASVTSGGATQEVSCSPLRVNGQKIEGCKCLPTNIEPDVSKGESATWTASGCTSKANITGYKWNGATADATGLVATAPVTAKGDEVKGVSFTVENDDSTAVTITCADAVAMDATKPDYEFKDQGNTNAISFTGNVDATVVFSLPSGWHGSDAGTCTFACQVDRGGSGDGKISGTLGTYEVAGGDYVTTSIPVSATTGGNAMAFKLNVGSNAGVNCHVAW
ncbi:MAG: hypothetical protein II850_10540 [Fibrobacter sp.]|nr:hypothetical protein [Fibrobacter sp.]